MKTLIPISMMLLQISSCETPKKIDLDDITKTFIGAPFSSLPSGIEDYSADFDCQVLVETGLSLAVSRNFTEFGLTINKIRYYDNSANDEAYRRHFISAEWLPRLANLGLLTDITSDIFEETVERRQVIDKESWFKKVKTPEEYALFTKSILPKQLLGRIRYIPIDKLFAEVNIKKSLDNIGRVVEIRTATLSKVANKIPNGSVILFVVRNSENYIKKIGSPLIIGHMAIAVWKGDALNIRHADLQRKTVQDLPLATYLRSTAKRFVGINVQKPRFGDGDNSSTPIPADFAAFSRAF